MTEVGPTRLDGVRLAAARLVAAELQPFLAEALYALSPVSAPQLGTFAVDAAWRVFIDPEVLARWSIPEVAGVLLHEVGHVVRDHHSRAQLMGIDSTTRRLWNIAADAEINDDLRDDGVVLPAGGVTPELLRAPRGKSAEHYFALLRDGRAHDPGLDPDCGPGAHGCGDHGDPIGRAAEPTTAVVGLRPFEATLVRRQVALAVMARARQPGRRSGGWQRWAEALLDPVLDWRQVLRSAVRGAVGAVSGAVDYRFDRPSRRAQPAVVLPSLRSPLPRVDVIIDTSASMDDCALGQAWTEVRACLRSVGVRRDLLRVWGGDTRATRVRSLAARVELVGGGGTDMAAILLDVASRRPRSDLIVVITDGFTAWPVVPPPARVVVAMVELGAAVEDHVPPRPPAAPAWATVVTIPRPSDDEVRRG